MSDRDQAPTCCTALRATPGFRKGQPAPGSVVHVSHDTPPDRQPASAPLRRAWDGPPAHDAVHYTEYPSLLKNPYPDAKGVNNSPLRPRFHALDRLHIPKGVAFGLVGVISVHRLQLMGTFFNRLIPSVEYTGVLTIPQQFATVVFSNNSLHERCDLFSTPSNSAESTPHNSAIHT